MLTLRTVPAVLLVQALVLLALGAATGWGMVGWAAGFGSAALMDVAVAGFVRRTGGGSLGPADLVTLLRATLTCGVVALVAESFLATATSTVTLTALAAVALALDWVDGRVARRTGTGSVLGAVLDGEADAYLMLVLSAWVAPSVGWWVLVIGLARYVFAVAGLALPWLRAALPFRYWRKVVTAVAGVVLVVAAAGVVPSPLIDVLLAIALLLVAESFGRDVGWLWRHRSVPEVGAATGTAAR